jgi:hypothetical protein
MGLRPPRDTNRLRRGTSFTGCVRLSFHTQSAGMARRFSRTHFSPCANMRHEPAFTGFEKPQCRVGTGLVCTAFSPYINPANHLACRP